MNSALKIRPMTLENLRTVIGWANKESWNLSNEDAGAFFAVDPTGFFAGEVNEELVAAVSAVKYSNYSHIGFYLVDDRFRKMGYGSKIFEEMMQSVKDIDSVGLDAVAAQKKNYEKWGFKAHEEVFRYGRKAQGSLSSSLSDLKRVPIDQIVEYDTPIFGGNSRRDFIRVLLGQESYYGLGKLKEGKMRGYGIIRKANMGYKIGPLAADDRETAEEILSGLQSYVNGEDVLIDVFESNKDGVEIMREQKWELVNTYYRMYLKSVPNMDTKKLYTSILEVG